MACAVPASLRILPHLQDTGGFFVAVLRRTGEPMAARAVCVAPRQTHALARLLMQKDPAPAPGARDTGAGGTRRDYGSGGGSADRDGRGRGR
jgi:hypothetical protein